MCITFITHAYNGERKVFTIQDPNCTQTIRKSIRFFPLILKEDAIRKSITRMGFRVSSKIKSKDTVAYHY